MRKSSAVLATLSLAVLALTGCTAAPTYDGASCDRTDSGHGIDQSVTVTGEVGAQPDVTIFSPLHVKETSFTDVVKGDGRAIENEQQPLTLELSIYSGKTGKQLYATQYDPANGQLANVSIWAQTSPGLGTVLQCATGGSRVVAALTPEDFGAKNLESFNLGKDDDVIFVIDVLDVMLAHAEGTPQFNDAQGMPTVVRAPDGTPGVIIPDNDAPTSQVTQTLIDGEGEKLGKDQVPILNVLAVSWDDRSVISNTWGQVPNTDLKSSNPAVAESLVGARVGSQVLVVTPAAKDGSATVYVVDVLGAVTPPSQ